MAINVVHSPSAAAIGGMAHLAGQGEYFHRMYPQYVQQNQFAAQLAHQDMTNAAQAAFQAQQAGLSRQFAEQAQMRNLAVQQQMEAQRQNRAFAQQHFLDQQRDLRQAQAYDMAMARDQQAQMARAQYDIDHQAMLLDRRNAFEQEQFRLQEAKQWMDRYSNPFAEYSKQVQEAQKAGFEYTPDENRKVQQVQGEMQRFRDKVNKGEITLADGLNQFKAMYGEMMSIMPSQKSASPAERWKQEAIEVRDPDTNAFLGYVTGDARSGYKQIVSPEKGGEKMPPMVEAKLKAITSWNDSIDKATSKVFDRQMQAYAGALQMGQPAEPPDYMAIRRMMQQEIPPPNVGDLPEDLQGLVPGGAVQPQQHPQPVGPVPGAVGGSLMPSPGGEPPQYQNMVQVTPEEQESRLVVENLERIRPMAMEAIDKISTTGTIGPDTQQVVYHTADFLKRKYGPAAADIKQWDPNDARLWAALSLAMMKAKKT